jgi:hypothetical protein
MGLVYPLTVIVCFKAPLQRLIVLSDFSSKKIRQRKKSVSVISAGSSEASERYQYALSPAQQRRDHPVFGGKV